MEEEVFPEKSGENSLPWLAGERPLMLAPMQGLTNRALRALFIELVRPDVVFTEFVRVRPGSKKSINEADRREVLARQGGVPLVVQLIGRSREALVAAAITAGELGAEHININLGCPFGRMSVNAAGGALLLQPTELPDILNGLRRVVPKSLSVKLRSGYDDPHQVFSLLPLLEDCGVDFLVLHPRTVRQRYDGSADHAVTAALVRESRLPVIANGDIFSVADFERVNELTGAAGFMFGRGAIADPWLFERVRGRAPLQVAPTQRRQDLAAYLDALLPRYRQRFCGERQTLDKLKDVLNFIPDPDLQRELKQLKKTRCIDDFCRQLARLSAA